MQLVQEKDLLRLQLHQLQDELEHNYLQSQALGNRLELAKRTEESLREAQRREIVVDMRKDINGENWYYAEWDGRWAGPGKGFAP